MCCELLFSSLTFGCADVLFLAYFSENRLKTHSVLYFLWRESPDSCLWVRGVSRLLFFYSWFPASLETRFTHGHEFADSRQA
ncbi:hypothetical protein FHS90_004550 [Rufibacter quisquiliarum]|uniref:Uncharacterized protein n=1 Tax=Rufibacter quisquiliarum TaxID=1549639 RepID=A0A839GSH7_9BACT|nr:hypothetical protein [Rufibacter quisquiliarum]